MPHIHCTAHRALRARTARNIARHLERLLTSSPQNASDQPDSNQVDLRQKQPRRARAAIILAAGQGTRMQSPTPKVLQQVGGRAMLDWAVHLANRLHAEPIIAVIGKHPPAVQEHAIKLLGPGNIAIQDPPLGTAHAVRMAQPLLRDFVGDILVIFADTPLIPSEVAEQLFSATGDDIAISALGFTPPDPGVYGRMVLDGSGNLQAIIEAKDATPEQRAIRLCNSGILAARSETFFNLLESVGNHNAKGEFYLTDVVALANRAGLRARAVETDADAVLGVNSLEELVRAEAIFQQRTRNAMLARGVAMTAPETVFFSHDTEIESGAMIEPYVIFGPRVRIAQGARIRAFSHLEGAQVDTDAVIGPFARLRPGATIGARAHIGNFVEVKNVTFGDDAKANHLAYLGDGSVGARTNIGAGVIFCNYDGYDKYQTHIGADAFIGSDCALVAPVQIGDGAYTGTGSVITDDVASGALAIGRGRQINKLGWATKFRLQKRSERNKP